MPPSASPYSTDRTVAPDTAGVPGKNVRSRATRRFATGSFCPVPTGPMARASITNSPRGIDNSYAPLSLVLVAVNWPSWRRPATICQRSALTDTLAIGSPDSSVTLPLTTA